MSELSLWGDEDPVKRTSMNEHLRRERKSTGDPRVSELLKFVQEKTGNVSINYGREGKAARSIFAQPCAPNVDEVKACFALWLERRDPETIIRYGCSLSTFQHNVGALLMQYRAGAIGDQSEETFRQQEIERARRQK